MKVYRKFALVMVINAVLMFLIPYVLIDNPGHLYFNLNRLYMTLMMLAPMGLVMLLVMGSMFPDKKLNYALLTSFSAMFLLCFVLVRTQTPMGDSQMMQSMIPNHSGEILMCKESELTDPQVKNLCAQIVGTQEAQIAQMKALLEHSQ